MHEPLIGHNQSLSERAYSIRRTALQMGKVKGQGYIAQALDVADILAVAYFHAMTYRPAEPEWEGRDRFYLSIGHYAIALYAALIEAGIISREALEDYGGGGSPFPISGQGAFNPRKENFRGIAWVRSYDRGGRRPRPKTQKLEEFYLQPAF